MNSMLVMLFSSSESICEQFSCPNGKLNQHDWNILKVASERVGPYLSAAFVSVCQRNSFHISRTKEYIVKLIKDREIAWLRPNDIVTSRDEIS